MNVLWIMVFLIFQMITKSQTKSSILDNSLASKIIANWPSSLGGHLHYCVGLSGGIDSVVLLHIFKQISQSIPINLSAIHINHGISLAANRWAEFCQHLCDEWQIPLKNCSVQVQKIGGEGLENSARKLRYQEYAKSNADVIILAHHQDDQIETMLSQIMRGSNLHNSAAMLTTMQRHNQHYWRPILDVSKQDIIAYAKHNKLSNIEDESNQDNRYLRNFLRNSILPQLLEFDNHVKTKLMASVMQLQIASKLNDELALIDLHNCQNNRMELVKSKFIELSCDRQLNLLTYWITTQSLPLPSNKQLQEFIRQVSVANLDRHPSLKLSPSHRLQASNQQINIISSINCLQFD